MFMIELGVWINNILMCWAKENIGWAK